MALAYILLLGDEHFDAIESSETSLPSRSKTATELVGQILAELFRCRERDYPTTIQEDELMVRAGNSSHRTSMAIQVRSGEKRVLQEAISTAKTFTGSNRKMRITTQVNSSNQGQKRKLEDQLQTKKKGRQR